MLVAGALVDEKEIMQALIEITTDEERSKVLARIADAAPASALSALRGDDDTQALIHRAVQVLLRKKMDEDVYGAGIYVIP